MTPQTKDQTDECSKQLESILEAVQSIDGTVEEIREALDDHFGTGDYEPDWRYNNYYRGDVD